MTAAKNDYYGALVGWTSEDFGKHMVLRMQSVTKGTPHTQDDIDSFFFMVNKNDALLLANYLYSISGQTAPKKKRGWLGRFLGA